MDGVGGAWLNWRRSREPGNGNQDRSMALLGPERAQGGGL